MTPATPPTIGNYNGIPTAPLLHSGTPSTLVIGAVASAVYKSRATLRPTSLWLIAASLPMPARARIPATLRPASPFQRLLPYLVWQWQARGTPTILLVGRLVSVSTLYPYHHTAVGLCMQRNSNAVCLHMPDRRTTSVSQTWMGRPPVSMALNGTPSMMQLGPVLLSCLFLHLDLFPTLPVRRNVARVHMPIGPHPRLQTASVGQLQVIVPLQVHWYLRPAFPRQQSLQRLQ